MRRRGFSLVETIVAIGLILGTLFVVVDVIPNALFLVRGRERQETAERLARSLLEEQSRQAFSQLTPGSDQALPDQILAGLTYHSHLKVDAVGQEPTSTLVCLRIEVEWDYHDTHHQVVRQLYGQHLRTD